MKRAELIRKGEMRLKSLERMFFEAISKGDFDSGKHWWSEYGGGLYMLETLDLIPLEEARKRSHRMLAQLTAAQLTADYKKENIWR